MIRARAAAHWTEERQRATFGPKALSVPPVEGAVLLRAMGLLRGDGAMAPAAVRKYLQVNHMVGLLRQDLVRHGADRPLRVLDAGCGRSYLSLVLAWCAQARWGLQLEVVGVDRNPAVIEECRRRAELAELAHVMTFAAGHLDELTPAPGQFDVVLALHACDRATCDALALAVRAEATLVAVAPCCQAELAQAWAAASTDQAGAGGGFAPVWRTPHLRRELGAHVTDAMRGLLLASAGYRVTSQEFVPAEHSRKNTLIRGERDAAVDRAAARADYAALVTATGGAGLALATRL
ncbi:MAG: SAM-dependent methyltransferase [Kofleriaceae bacterium]|nr:SAM-dependent methyltransferase [Kofleriaceae bacterium]MBP6836977.1 SAM-dependent methyltransferase [Kofleriaceae bacterium]MBP9202994.1 SAM-dependent methyltransferase [Kofleriaceae bacterium]